MGSQSRQPGGQGSDALEALVVALNDGSLEYHQPSRVSIREAVIDGVPHIITSIAKPAIAGWKVYGVMWEPVDHRVAA